MSLGVDNTAIAATISLEDVALRPWDVVVAGAGPAGSLVARALAAEGATVLLVDKSAFPREKVCGSCLNGAAMAALGVAGLADLPQQLGAIALQNMQLRAGRYAANLALPGGVSLSRRALDAALVRAAIEKGAAFLPSTDATLEPIADDFREVRLRRAGQGIKVKARIGVAADGLSGSFLKETPGMEPIVVPGSPLGAGAVVDGGSELYLPGTIYMACTRDGYVGAVRLEDGRLDVAMAMDQSRMRSLGGAVAAVGQILHAVGFPALPTEALFRGTPLLTRHRPRVAGPGLFVLGDAAGYLEPFTGEGISWAMQQALLLVPIVREAIPGPKSQHAEVWQLQCQRFFRQQRRYCQAAIWMRRNFNLGTRIVALLGWFPGLASPLVRALNTPCSDILKRCAR
jgi:flavin-dependent dehydrogenase